MRTWGPSVCLRSCLRLTLVHSWQESWCLSLVHSLERRVHSGEEKSHASMLVRVVKAFGTILPALGSFYPSAPSPSKSVDRIAPVLGTEQWLAVLHFSNRGNGGIEWKSESAHAGIGMMHTHHFRNPKPSLKCTIMKMILSSVLTCQRTANRLPRSNRHQPVPVQRQPVLRQNRN